MVKGYCKSCNRITGFKRALGWGTFFGAISTFGLLLFLIPFYPKRCVICGSMYSLIDSSKGHSESPNNNDKGNLTRTEDKPLGQIRNERVCPHCAELILKKARVCKHCGRDVEPLITNVNIARFIEENTSE
jgi:hypothetical protein